MADGLRKRVPAGKLVNAPKILATPIIRALPAIEDEPQLREAFLELLAKSMHAELQSAIHPAYAMVLAQLSPDEAKLLQGIQSADEDYPLPRFNSRALDRAGTITGEFDAILLKTHDALVAPQHGGLYFANLLRLGVLREDRTKIRNIPSLYERIERGRQHLRWMDECPSAGSFTVGRSVVALTPFGLGFVDAVLTGDIRSIQELEQTLVMAAEWFS